MTNAYTIAPPPITPLLEEYGDYNAIPEEAMREWIAAQAYWARCWRMYADPPRRSRKSREAPLANPP